MYVCTFKIFTQNSFAKWSLSELIDGSTKLLFRELWKDEYENLQKLQYRSTIHL